VDGRRVVPRAGSDRRRYRHLLLIVAVLALAGCGGGGSTGGGITVGAAKRYTLRQQVNGDRVQLTVIKPDGTPLVRYRHGSGPHTGLHLIFVRRDLGKILHLHPPEDARGTVTADVSSLPPGPYRIVLDVYPASGAQSNFQLFGTLTRPGTYTPTPLPALERTQVVDGYTIALHGTPKLRAVTPALLHFTVTGPDGKPAHFTPWFGALAHAIFFRRQTLDYFHTHVCAPGATGCGSVLGSANVTGESATPGQLDVGVLVPVGGTWRLFLQCLVDGHVLTAPFTLQVK
jgi:hypothetical protein